MAKIYKDRPLPKHTRLDYDECYAKLVLETFCQGEFQNLIISDKPDLRTPDGKVGIEVTSAIPKLTQEAESLAAEIPYIDEKNQKKRIEYLRKIGFEYGEHCMTHPVESYCWSGFELPDVEKIGCKKFLDAVKRKIEKLNGGHYDLLEEYMLYVQSDLLIEDWMLKKLLNKLTAISKTTLSYTIIYLFALNGLFVFDIPHQTHMRLETDKRLLWGISGKARDLVEEGEDFGSE